MLFFNLLFFRFFAQKISYPYHNIGKTIHWKTENDTDDIITITIKRTCRNFNSFNFQQFSIFINDNIEYLQVLVVQRIFCQLQIESPVMASLYIYKLKINAKCKKRHLRGEKCQSTMYLP